MGPWLASGRRRDCCVLLYGTGGLRGQQLKSRLEAHYGERLDPSSFYGALDTLVSNGHLEERTDGIHDVYALTDGGRRALEEHYEWLQASIEESDDEEAGGEGDDEKDGAEGDDRNSDDGGVEDD